MTQNMNEKIIRTLRKKVENYQSLGNYQTALFLADKVATMKGCPLQDLHSITQSMFHMKQYDRVIKIIEGKKAQFKHMMFRHLLAKCYYKTKKYREAVKVCVCL